MLHMMEKMVEHMVENARHWWKKYMVAFEQVAIENGLSSLMVLCKMAYGPINSDFYRLVMI